MYAIVQSDDRLQTGQDFPLRMIQGQVSRVPRVSRLAFITVVSAACTQHRNNETIFQYLQYENEISIDVAVALQVRKKKKRRRDVFRDTILQSIHHLLEHLPALPSSCLKHFKMESLHRLSLLTRRLKLSRKLFVVRNDVSKKSCTVSKWTHSAVICLLSSYLFSETLHSLSVSLYNTFLRKISAFVNVSEKILDFRLKNQK